MEVGYKLMVEVVFALLLIVDNKIVEHRIQDSLMFING